MSPRVSLGVIVVVGLLIARDASAAEEPPPRRVSFNSGWLFTKDDPPDAQGKLEYPNIRPWVVRCGEPFRKSPTTAPAAPRDQRPGEDVSYVRDDFDDSAWRKLD